MNVNEKKKILMEDKIFESLKPDESKMQNTRVIFKKKLQQQQLKTMETRLNCNNKTEINRKKA